MILVASVKSHANAAASVIKAKLTPVNTGYATESGIALIERANRKVFAAPSNNPPANTGHQMRCVVSAADR